jgi:para-aminobenzoate synthetase component 1
MNLTNESHPDSRSLNDKIKALIGLSKKIGETNSSKGLRLLKPCYLLSKSDKGATNNQFSFFMANPTNVVNINNKEGLAVWHSQLSCPPSSNAISASTSRNEIPFHSGWVGVYAYPGITPQKNSSKQPQTNSNLAEFNYYPWVICLAHNTGEFHLLGKPDPNAKLAFESLQETPKSQLEPAKSTTKDKDSRNSFQAEKFISSWSKVDYKNAFNRVQAYLEAGDCYQVNLTHPHKAKYQGYALDTLLPLHTSLNPSFGCYFEGQDFELISVSPERLLNIDTHGKLEAKPIKGTIKRSSVLEKDQQLIKELINSDKNQAENLMIVDLLRNDLSRSAEPNSVKVDKLFELETHPNVHHLVSTISGQLKTSLYPAQAIENAFPGGSITGAPKKRAMEIIEELEVQPRSLYCGSFGYYSDTGNTDFNILIRSLEFRDGEITCWGGGGITIESDCDEEYEESLTKIRRIMETVEKT